MVKLVSQIFFTLLDKTIKLWKVYEKRPKSVVKEADCGTPLGIHMPRVTSGDPVKCAVPRKIFANAHAYHINSISINRY